MKKATRVVSGGCLVLIACLALVFPGAGAQALGLFGERPLPDGRCVEGDNIDGWCQHCGSPGERCCNEQPRCKDMRDGYQCEGNPGRERCERMLERDFFEPYCGWPGTPPCRRSDGGPPYCHYRALVSGRICIHCGLLRQPCCPDTEFTCDYGECTAPYPHLGGICVLKKPSTAATSAIPAPSGTPSGDGGFGSLSGTAYEELEQGNFDIDLGTPPSAISAPPPYGQAPGAPAAQSCLRVRIEKKFLKTGRGGRVGSKYPFTNFGLRVVLVNECASPVEVQGSCRFAVGHWSGGIRSTSLRHTVPANAEKGVIHSGVYASPQVGDGTVTCSGTFSVDGGTHAWSGSG